MSDLASEDPPDNLDALKKKLDEAEKDFGQKRAQFRSMYLGCEAALQEEKQLRLKCVEQIDKLKKELEDANSENQGIRAAAQLSDESRQEEISRSNAKHQEELASYQHIWKEAVNEAKNSVASGYEEERQQLTGRLQQLEQQLSERSSKAEDKPEGLMSMMSQAIKRTTASPQSSNAHGKQKEAASLEATMKEAQENAETLRNIVRPLEEEIGMLKGKLKDCQSKLKAYESKNKSSSTGSSSSEVTEEAESFEELQEKSKELQGYLDAERSSRTDLEMFVAVLNTQKGVLQEDADALRSELHNVCRLLEQERMSHRELKQTWRMANDEFLEQQTLLSIEIECMRTYLNHNQLEKLSRELRKKKAQHVKPKSTPTPPLIKKSTERRSISSSPRHDNLTPVASPSLSTSSDRLLVLSSSSSSCDESDAENDAPVILSSPASIEQGEEVNEDGKLDSSKMSASLRKAASSSDILTSSSKDEAVDFTDRGLITPAKSRSQGDITEPTAGQNNLDSNVERNLHLNETGWSPMAESASYHASCMMCQNYEKQLQRLQKECIAYKEKDDNLQSALKMAKERVKVQDEENEALQTGISSSAEDSQGQINAFQKHQEKHEQQLLDMQADFLALHQEVVEQLDLMKERQQMSDAANEVVEISVTKEQASDQLDASALSTKEQELTGQIMFLKDRVMAEQFDKENMENILQQDLEIAKQEISLLKEKLANVTQ